MWQAHDYIYLNPIHNKNANNGAVRINRKSLIYVKLSALTLPQEWMIAHVSEYNPVVDFQLVT